jgi:hypothetical protein
MKIRIKGASVRLRLSRSEVAGLLREGRVAEATPFVKGTFRYEVMKTSEGEQLSAGFEDGCITMYVPEALIMGWDRNDLVSIDGHMPLGNGDSLYLLLEKDFQCLDHAGEDQSDYYINPNKSC